MARKDVYPAAHGFPPIPAIWGKTLVSISHWGVFDIEPFGAIMHLDRVVWQENGEDIAEYPVNGYEFERFFRPVWP